jgi:hypothetical protein
VGNNKAVFKTQQVCPGDFVADPMDGNSLREVMEVDGSSVYMTDGGVMGLDEIEHVYLPSEVGC